MPVNNDRTCSEPPVVAVPCMHPVVPETGTGALSLPQVRFFNPGLAPLYGSEDDERCSFTPAGLPFTGAAARACLHELASLAETFGNSRDLVVFALDNEKAQDHAHKHAGQQELADLEAFVAAGGGSFAPAAPHEPLMKNPLVEAQKTLLLAYSLEESVSELETLQSRYESSLASMGDLLGAERDADLQELAGLAGAPSALEGRGTDMMRLSWRVVLDNMAVFLPEGTVLVTDDGGMKDVLAAMEETAALDAQEAAALCSAWDDSALAAAGRLMKVQAPLWRILGHGRVPEGRDWQQTVFTVVFGAES